MNYTMTKQVMQKPGTKIYGKIMVILCIVFVGLGIFMNRGMFLPAFLMAGFYFYYNMISPSKGLISPDG